MKVSNSYCRVKICLMFATAVLAFGLAGCGHKEGEHAHEEGEGGEHAERAAGVTYSEKHGLEVPAETAKFIGLEIAEVEERKVAATFDFQAQVFRAASEAQFASTQPTVSSVALATAMLSTNEAARLGADTQVTVPGADGKRLAARISELHPTGGNGHIEIIVAVQDAEGVLKCGETIKISVLGAEKTVMAVPRKALLKTAEGNFVYTLSGDHYLRTLVKVGEVNEEFAEISEGLLTGDQVVVKPVMTLWLAELQSIRGGKACADGH